MSGDLGRREWCALAATLLFGGNCVAGANQAQANEIRLGDSLVRLVVRRYEPTGLTYIHVHENEVTSAEAAERFVTSRGGRLIEVQSSRTRLISFHENGNAFQFDPNRMFTDIGIEKSLRHYGHYTHQAHERVAVLRDAVIRLLLGEKRLIVAVHNNEGMSIKSYQQHGEFAADAGQVAVDPGKNIHDFILVLDKQAFDRLKAAGFNVVLQSRSPADDGSLSVWCQQAGIPYVNIEASFGHESTQLAMLEAVHEWAFRRA